MFSDQKIRLTALCEEDVPLYRKWSSEPAFGRFYNAAPIRKIP